MSGGVFSDSHRRTKVALGLLALLAFGVGTTVRAMGDLVFADCAAEPLRFDGIPLVLSLYRVDELREPDEYVLRKGSDVVPVVGPVDGLQEGAAVSIVGRYDARRNAVIADEREIHVHLPWKEGLGLAALFGWVLSLPISFTWRASRLEQRAVLRRSLAQEPTDG